MYDEALRGSSYTRTLFNVYRVSNEEVFIKTNALQVRFDCSTEKVADASIAHNLFAVLEDLGKRAVRTLYWLLGHVGKHFHVEPSGQVGGGLTIPDRQEGHGVDADLASPDFAI